MDEQRKISGINNCTAGAGYGTKGCGTFIKENKKAYIDRPLLVDENSINKLYQERISTYKQCLDIEIDTNSTILNTINEILTKLM